MSHAHHGHHHHAGDAATDPVCGMKVDPATAKDRFEYEGVTYYFCCDGCLEMFRKDPARHLAKQAPAPHAATAQLQ